MPGRKEVRRPLLPDQVVVAGSLAQVVQWTPVVSQTGCGAEVLVSDPESSGRFTKESSDNNNGGK